MRPLDLGLPAAKFPAFRAGQYDLALDISLSTRRIFCMSAPPGSGKSAVYISSHLLADNGRTLIVVPNKPLQSQLMNDFAEIGLSSIVGHSNYPCYNNYNGNINGNSDGDSRCRAPRGECEYRDIDCVRIRKAKLVVTNIQHWISIGKSEEPDRLGKFDTLIIDESHEAHDILVSQLAISIHSAELRSLTIDCQLPPSTSHFYEWVMWARELLPTLRNIYAVLNKKAVSAYDKSQLAKLRSISKDISRLADITKDEYWIVEKKSKLGTPLTVTISPVWATRYVEEYIFRGIPKIVLSSGTMSELDCEYLSITADQLDFRDIASTFPVSRRPIYYIPTTKIEYSMTDGQKRLVINKIDRIIDARLDRKGFIQSRSYDYASDILSMSSMSDFMISHKKGGVAGAVESFIAASPPSILVSPAIEEGFDFYDDRARYGFLWKVPFLNKKTPIVEARCKQDKRYSTLVTSRTIIQCVMRLIRSMQDWGEYFILDDHFAHFRRSGYFPLWIKSAFKEVRDIPEPLNLQ